MASMANGSQSYKQEQKARREREQRMRKARERNDQLEQQQGNRE